MNSAEAPVTRFTGLDLARYLALLGMFVSHASIDLASRASLDDRITGLAALPTDPVWAYALQSIFVDRSRPLFILIAGIGITLLARHGSRTIALRAVFVLALGLAFGSIGWWGVLPAYGLLFLAAIVLVRFSSAVLVGGSILLLCLPAAVSVIVGPDAVVAQTIAMFLAEDGFFCAGIALGRVLHHQRLLQRIALGAGAVTIAGFVGLAAMGGFNISTMDGTMELALGTVSTFALCLTVVTGLVLVLDGRSTARGPLRWFTTAGRMPLSIYAVQLASFAVVDSIVHLTLGAATAFVLLLLAACTVLANALARAGRRGPLEALLHDFSRARPLRKRPARTATEVPSGVRHVTTVAK